MFNSIKFKAAANLNNELTDRWFAHIYNAMRNFDISTPERQAHFIAQIGVESKGFKDLIENFNYSVDGLRIFGARLTFSQRELLGRQPNASALPAYKQAEIANLVYGGRYGNNLGEDGWKYRGRGLKQITFRGNYAACGEALNLALIEYPDLLLEEAHAANSAGWFWKVNHCNKLADENDVAGLTKIINGGSNGLQDRVLRTEMALKVLCKP